LPENSNKKSKTDEMLGRKM